MEEPRTITINEQQREAIGEILDLAAHDRENYLYWGNPGTDYGDEWPEAALRMAETYRAIAASLGPLFHGETDRWNAIAECFEKSAKEYEEQKKENV